MSEWGDGPPEIEPDIAIIQARQRGPSTSPGSGELPTAFVGSLNGLGGALTLQAGSLPAGIGVTYTQGANTISFNLTGLGALATVKCHVDPTNDPGVGDDDTQGYSQFSQWLNELTPQAWMCLDASTGAAVWAKLAP